MSPEIHQSFQPPPIQKPFSVTNWNDFKNPNISSQCTNICALEWWFGLSQFFRGISYYEDRRFFVIQGCRRHKNVTVAIGTCSILTTAFGSFVLILSLLFNVWIMYRYDLSSIELMIVKIVVDLLFRLLSPCLRIFLALIHNYVWRCILVDFQFCHFQSPTWFLTTYRGIIIPIHIANSYISSTTQRITGRNHSYFYIRRCELLYTMDANQRPAPTPPVDFVADSSEELAALLRRWLLHEIETCLMMIGAGPLPESFDPGVLAEEEASSHYIIATHADLMTELTSFQENTEDILGYMHLTETGRFSISDFERAQRWDDFAYDLHEIVQPWRQVIYQLNNIPSAARTWQQLTDWIRSICPDLADRMMPAEASPESPASETPRRVFEDPTCSICTELYTSDENLRVLSRCGHRFHLLCFNAWLRHSDACPVCRRLPVAPVCRRLPVAPVNWIRPFG